MQRKMSVVTTVSNQRWKSTWITWILPVQKKIPGFYLDTWIPWNPRYFSNSSTLNPSIDGKYQCKKENTLNFTWIPGYPKYLDSRYFSNPGIFRIQVLWYPGFSFTWTKFSISDHDSRQLMVSRKQLAYKFWNRIYVNRVRKGHLSIFAFVPRL